MKHIKKIIYILVIGLCGFVGYKVADKQAKKLEEQLEEQQNKMDKQLKDMEESYEKMLNDFNNLCNEELKRSEAINDNFVKKECEKLFNGEESN